MAKPAFYVDVQYKDRATIGTFGPFESRGGAEETAHALAGRSDVLSVAIREAN